MKKPPKSRKTKAVAAVKDAPKIRCTNCDAVIPAREKAFFVEEEVGRLFCSEPCIVASFRPEIAKLEKLYAKHVTANELDSEERAQLSYLRWKSLEEPTDAYLEKTIEGDHRYSLICEEKVNGKPIYGVAVCLMLRGEPSFLFIAFVTSNPHLVDVFRRGDRMKVEFKNQKPEEKTEGGENPIIIPDHDRLAEGWTLDDSMRASLSKDRKKSDIPEEDFAFYQNCIEETLKEPDELWSYEVSDKKRKAYHFIKRYEHETPFWYVVIARDADDPSQIELMDAFPTNNATLVKKVRHGNKEQLPYGSAIEEEALPATGTSGSSGKRNIH